MDDRRERSRRSVDEGVQIVPVTDDSSEWQVRVSSLTLRMKAKIDLRE